MDNTKIEWCDASWNPLVGCTRVSAGCENCYAEQMAARFSDPGQYYESAAKRTPAGGRWTRKIIEKPDKLEEPLKWRKPRRIFVNSMSDLFHEDVRDEFIDQVFAVMALCLQHRFIILTKRHKRMRDYVNGARKGASCAWPLPHVTLGVSCEDQATADERVPYLLNTPAAIRVLSIEPLLGPIDIRPALPWDIPGWEDPAVDWVLVGGESGRHARPMHPDWARSLRDQCVAHDTPFFFKQWGAWRNGSGFKDCDVVAFDGRHWPAAEFAKSPRPECIEWPVAMRRVGKKHAGRELDGRTWDECPAALELGSEGREAA